MSLRLTLCMSAALASCSALPDQLSQWTGNDTKPLEELNYPGFFDVGVGFGFVTDRPFKQTDASGVMLSLRAYPAGRWYSTLKSNGAVASTILEESVATMLAAPKYLTSANLLDDDACDYYIAILSRPGAEAKEKLAGARAETGFLEAQKVDTDAGKALHASELPEVLTLLTTIEDAVTAAKSEAKTFVTPTTLKASAKIVAAIQAVEEAAEKMAADPAPDTETLKTILANLAKAETSLNDTEWYVVDDRSSWRHRLAVFYGRTLDDLGGDIDAAANVVGVSYDVAPQFALVAGWAFVDGDSDTNSSLYFGTSLNLNAFKEFFGDLFGS